MLTANWRETATLWGLFPEQIKAIEIMDEFPTKEVRFGNQMAVTPFVCGPLALLKEEELEVVKAFWRAVCQKI